MMWGPHMYYFWGNDGFWGLSGLLPILFFIGFVILIFSLFRKSSDDGEIDDEDTALEILKKRYAKGELTKREYLDMKKDIVR